MTDATGGPTPGPDSIFRAFRDVRPGRARALWLSAGAGLLLIALLVAVDMRGRFPVVTPHGIRTLRLGMSLSDVAGVLGRPLAPAPSPAGQECLRYGSLHWRTVFSLYSVCFEGGKVRSVEQRHYGIWKVRHDGVLVPFEEPKPPPKPLL